MNNIQFNVEALQGGAVDSLRNSIIIETLQTCYPVGTLYWSEQPNDPTDWVSSLPEPIPWKWEQVTDTFILAAGTTYPAGSSGGEATHALTVNEMPSHSHSFGVSRYVPALLSKDIVDVHAPDRTGSTYRVPGTSSTGPGWNDMTNTAAKGGGLPHNNMPPYIAMYCYKRIQ